MKALSPQDIASEAARSLAFEDGGRIIRPAQCWHKRDHLNLIGQFECEFPGLAGTHRIPVTAHFGTEGQLLSLVARDPLFGDPIGAATSLPAAAANLGASASFYEEMGLWLDQSTNLVWVPGIWGKGHFTFDSAQRLPRRLAEGEGYKGFCDWRIPSTSEFDGLYKQAHDHGLLDDGRPLAGLGRFIAETEFATVWTSDPSAEPSWGLAYQLSGARSDSRAVSLSRQKRFPIMLVREALESD